MKSQESLQTEKILALAVELARSVGARIREVVESRQTLEISHKGPSDLVTQIDVWSEQVITERVKSEYPSHLVVGEETSAALSDSCGKRIPQIVKENICWIVDPLDGTTNFSNRIPYCAVSIGVCEYGEKQIGVVYDPFRDEMFTAVRGQGAKLNGVPIFAGEKLELIETVVATGFPNDRWQNWKLYEPTIQSLIMSCRNVRSFGAAAIDLCWVACGRFDGFCEYNLKAWDVAAGSLIVEEAGGKGVSFGSRENEDSTLFARCFLFSGKKLFPKLFELVEKTAKHLPAI